MAMTDDANHRALAAWLRDADELLEALEAERVDPAISQRASIPRYTPPTQEKRLSDQQHAIDVWESTMYLHHLGAHDGTSQP